MYMSAEDRIELIVKLAEHAAKNAGPQELEDCYYQYQVEVLDDKDDEELEMLADVYLKDET